MEDNFNFEIVSPERIIFSENVSMVTLPSYEGDMSILKNHISIITFLRPGIVKAEKKRGHWTCLERSERQKEGEQPYTVGLV